MRKLNKKQEQTLNLALQLRFITAPLITELNKLKSRQSTVVTLNRLVSKGYLGVRKSKNTDFSNRGNSYYLTPDGYRMIESDPKERILRRLYRNKTVTKKFVNHSTDVFRACILLGRIMPSKAEIYTSIGMGEIIDDEDLLLSPPSDLFIHDASSDRYIFIDVLHDEHLFIAKKRLRGYIEIIYEWYLEERVDLIFILGSKSDETNFLKYVQKKIEESSIYDVTIFTTTLDRLKTREKDQFNAIDIENYDEIIKNVELSYAPSKT